MPHPEKTPFYLFMHIPKTAGTSLRSVVDLNLGAKNVLTYYNQNSRQLLDNLDNYLKVKPNFKAIIGHFGFGLHDIIQQPSKYITFLRHPVSRTISQYKEHFINQPERLQNEDGEILGLADSIKTNPELYENYQTQHLVADVQKNEPDDLICERAQDNFNNHFIMVGLVEHFEESISLMSEKLSWPPTETPKLNVKPTNFDITPDLIEQILDINKIDFSIYEFARIKLLNELDSLRSRS